MCFRGDSGKQSETVHTVPCLLTAQPLSLSVLRFLTVIRTYILLTLSMIAFLISVVPSFFPGLYCWEHMGSLLAFLFKPPAPFILK